MVVAGKPDALDRQVCRVQPGWPSRFKDADGVGAITASDVNDACACKAHQAEDGVGEPVICQTAAERRIGAVAVASMSEDILIKGLRLG